MKNPYIYSEMKKQDQRRLIKKATYKALLKTAAVKGNVLLKKLRELSHKPPHIVDDTYERLLRHTSPEYLHFLPERFTSQGAKSFFTVERARELIKQLQPRLGKLCDKSWHLPVSSPEWNKAHDELGILLRREKKLHAIARRMDHHPELFDSRLDTPYTDRIEWLKSMLPKS